MNLSRNLLGGITSSSNNSASQNTNISNLHSDDLQQNESSIISSHLAAQDSNNSPFLAKYTKSSKLSENANNLMERKRNLILESKK